MYKGPGPGLVVMSDIDTEQRTFGATHCDEVNGADARRVTAERALNARRLRIEDNDRIVRGECYEASRMSARRLAPFQGIHYSIHAGLRVF